MRTQLAPFLRGLVLFALQYGFNGAMYQQIRITAYRRSEVGISLIAQTEVPDVFRLVLGLAQGTQHHGLQQPGIGTTLDALEQLGIIGRLRIIFTGQLQAEFLHELAQRFELFWCWSLVNTIQNDVLMFM